MSGWVIGISEGADQILGEVSVQLDYEIEGRRSYSMRFRASPWASMQTVGHLAYNVSEAQVYLERWAVRLGQIKGLDSVRIDWEAADGQD